MNRESKKYVYMLVLAALAVTVFVMSDRARSRGRHVWPVTTLNGTALGTVYQISVKGEMPDGLRDKLDSLFHAADGSLSVFNSDSRLSRINDNRTDTADGNIIYCLDLARQVCELSGGMYDVTVRPLAAALGFSGGDARRLSAQERDSLLQLVGYDKLRIEDGRVVKARPGMQIDLNSIAKGAVVDMAARLLEREGVDEYLVDIGGEIFCRGTNAEGKKWKVGVESPFEGNYSLGKYLYTSLSLTGKGLATSGNYRNYYVNDKGEKYTHIINPLTGENTAGSLLSATVIADNCALADAYGTMFIALGYERAVEVAEKNHIAALFIHAVDDGMETFVTEEMKQYWNGKKSRR